MSRALFISRGIDPVPIYSDLAERTYLALVNGKQYRWSWDEFPFVMDDDYCVDAALIIAHGAAH